jgi:hypothetical protein
MPNDGLFTFNAERLLHQMASLVQKHTSALNRDRVQSAVDLGFAIGSELRHPFE